MKIYVTAPKQFGIGLHRAAYALGALAPAGCTLWPTLDGADFAVFHVIGWGFLEEARAWIEAGKPYALMQYCWQTSENPDVAAWMPYWNQATAVWSYYRLPDAGIPIPDDLRKLPFDVAKAGLHRNLYFAPMGVDVDVFRPRLDVNPGEYALLTSGHIAETETVKESADAIARINADTTALKLMRPGLQMFHLGPDFGFGPHVVSKEGLSDDVLASVYSRCERVAALRRCEGFEMPAAEGLLCGARPLAFDAPHYRDWFGDWADYIPEEDPVSTEISLYGKLQHRPRRVTIEERQAAMQLFDWRNLVPAFWERAL